ncbi:MAG TPA: DNA polymerase I, partial [Actinomycetes bacterium]
MLVPAESDDVVASLGAAGAGRGSRVGVAWAPGGVGFAHGGAAVWCRGEGVDAVRGLVDAMAPRLVWWSAASARPLVEAGVHVTASWDVAATHRLLHGGSDADPGVVWAVAAGLPAGERPRTGQLDLLGLPSGPARAGGDDPAEGWDPVRPDGHLRPDWAEAGPPGPAAAAAWAAAALQVADRHAAQLADLPDGRREPGTPSLPTLTAWSESAAELLAVELGRTGLPLDRETAGALVAERVGPRPVDAAAAAASRARRDAEVLSHLPGAPEVDLRNPAQVRDLLLRVGIDLPDTRSWRLEPLRGAHPLVDALLTWRKAERIATTYGYSWLDRHVGSDGRLRGSWTGCDGAAGRMTASAGLHNLPGELRPAVVAEPGHVLVRADLGQV